VLASAVEHTGKNTVFKASAGYIWYFPKGEGHVVQGLEDGGHEYLLVFDNGNSNTEGVTFNIDDWLLHMPPSVLAKNFGVPNDTFKHVPNPTGSIARGMLNNSTNTTGIFGELRGNSSYYFPSSKMPFNQAPGGGGSFLKLDSTNFPIAKDLAQILWRCSWEDYGRCIGILTLVPDFNTVNLGEN
jgi:hypothetical protein